MAVDIRSLQSLYERHEIGAIKNELLEEVDSSEWTCIFFGIKNSILQIVAHLNLLIHEEAQDENNSIREIYRNIFLANNLLKDSEKFFADEGVELPQLQRFEEQLCTLRLLIGDLNTVSKGAVAQIVQNINSGPRTKVDDEYNVGVLTYSTDSLGEEGVKIIESNLCEGFDVVVMRLLESFHAFNGTPLPKFFKLEGVVASDDDNGEFLAKTKIFVTHIKNEFYEMALKQVEPLFYSITPVNQAVDISRCTTDGLIQNSCIGMIEHTLNRILSDFLRSNSFVRLQIDAFNGEHNVDSGFLDYYHSLVESDE